MARIRLAHWHGDHPPGAEIQVDDDQVPGLFRDGRIAEVLDEAPPRHEEAAAPESAAPPAVEAEQRPDSGAPVSDDPTGRRRRV